MEDGKTKRFLLPDPLTVISPAFALIAYGLMGGGRRAKECNISLPQLKSMPLFNANQNCYGCITVTQWRII